MVLRPHLDELLEKLKEAKRQGIDIILCTSATNQWVARFFRLKPDFFTVFNKLYTHDNMQEWRNFSEKQNPIEYKIWQENSLIAQGKPITTFGYDSILFIDDNLLEGEILKQLYETAGSDLHTDVTFFSGFAYNGGSIPMSVMMGLKRLSTINYEIASKMKKYIQFEDSNPGCQLMCQVIDKFMRKEFVPGLTLEDDNYWENYNDGFLRVRDALQDELEGFAWKANVIPGQGIFENQDQLRKEALEYMATDKTIPYEGIIEKDINEPISNRNKDSRPDKTMGFSGIFGEKLFNKNEPDR